ncbi:Zinc finger CCCH domain-containing protein 45 [Cyphellophora attinorum]|uniref:Zinc finger CCCH domain-containing protein 45 n=1 Tax=Cyphellophora attinorum TaxID=1664694 RepID=A0A0N1HBQ5_9EURO|nr:Zinc finger CCCH domain-containing protein 45 [Phialophora attinorum]KPI45677.1 Zinc finger CCCH domain-containing protein 45 [Phialophora attinorum]
MAYYYVQSWFHPLPVIIEDLAGMGDGPNQPPDNNLRLTPDGSPLHSIMNVGVAQPNMGYDAFGQSRYAAGATNAIPMDMRSLAGALPTLPMRNQQQQSFQQYPGGQSAMYQYYSGAQFAGQTGAGFNPNTAGPAFQNYQSQSRQNYAGVPISTQTFQSAGQQVPQGMVQNIQAYHAPNQHLLPSSQYTAYPIRGGHNMRSGGGSPGMYQNPQPPMTRASSGSSAHASSTSFLRGPPRKPRQSGFALWVGNLPPGTNIVDLKDYFSRDATEDIESVFLISKSNCAFVNYKSEESCQAAMGRFHETRFQGVRLVCRLRRGSNTSPSPQQEAERQNVTSPIEQGSAQPEERVKEKFFVVKSLTLEDLERSVQSGVWATQAHNEAALTKAYESADDVYLIFSANKSGEYFGYAKMASAIGDEEAAAKTEVLPKAPTTNDPVTTPSPNPGDLPLAIITPPTATAPRGRIIDDSSRGTIFWEALNAITEPTGKDDTQTTEAEANPVKVVPSGSGNISSAEGTGYESSTSATLPSPTPQSFGKPFKIEWLSTDRLPFFRTRGLRNPWNANREVKIARDGTEIEPSIGRRLVQMFHIKFPEPAPMQMHQQQQQQLHGLGFGGGRGPAMVMSPQQQHQQSIYSGQMGQTFLMQQQPPAGGSGGGGPGGGGGMAPPGFQGYAGGGNY